METNLHSADSDISQLFKNARADPTLLSQLNIDELLNTLDDKNDHLENKTLDDISQEIYDALCSVEWLPPQKRKEFCNNLLEYRYADEVHKIHIGKYIKVLRIQPVPENVDEVKLCPGGFVLKVFFTQKGAYLFCRNVNEKTYTYKMTNFLFFQKMSTEEQMILVVNEELLHGDHNSDNDDDDETI
jgi:hypothetical protein